ncbi:MAG TPA: universal stress protein [Nitrospirota bacterium]|nr:universal stress protein [Nitrospirota bacterium]
MPKRSILVADDIENQTDSGKRRSQAIWKAASFLAQWLKTGIDLLYVEDLKAYPVGKLGLFRFPAWHFSHQERLEEVGKQCNVPVSCSVKSGSPADQILKVLRSHSSTELVVVGTQGRRGVKRLLIGSVAEEVIRRSKRPVTVIGPIAQEMGIEISNQKKHSILVPTDLGKNSRAAEQYSLSLAKRIGARVTLFHCLWDRINAVIINAACSGMPVFNIDEIINESRAVSLDSIKRKTSFFQNHGVPCDYKIEEKAVTASFAIYRECVSGYSIVVMGTHGRNVLLNAFFGSTARETILNATIPVIVVHSGS